MEQTKAHEELVPFSDDEHRQAVRRMYRIEHLVTVREAAGILGVSDTRTRIIAAAMGCGMRWIGGQRRFTRDELVLMAGRQNRRLRKPIPTPTDGIHDGWNTGDITP